MRAYSMASANHEHELEFFSIKVPDGPLTSKLQDIQVGDEVLVNSKSTGTLVLNHLLPGRNLYLIATGTGLAPFMSIIKDPVFYFVGYNVILFLGGRHHEDGNDRLPPPPDQIVQGLLHTPLAQSSEAVVHV